MTIAYMESSPALTGKARQYSRGYRRIALVEIEGNNRPAMISERAKGVVRIIEDHTVYIGSSERSEGRRLKNDLMARADKIFN